MSLQDPISDMLTRIRNAHMAKKTNVVMPFSKHKREIASVLLDQGYISGVNEESVDNKKNLLIDLKYFEGAPVISEIKRFSRPGLRRYMKCDEIPKIKNGLGIIIVSTSKGLMSDHQARKQRLGGELLCTVC